VFFDGKALNTLDTSAVRRQLGVVLQDSKLAHGKHLREYLRRHRTASRARPGKLRGLAAVDADIKQMRWACTR